MRFFAVFAGVFLNCAWIHAQAAQPALEQLLKVQPRDSVSVGALELPKAPKAQAVSQSGATPASATRAAQEKKVLIWNGAIDNKPLRGNAIPPGAQEEDIQWENWVKYFIRFEQKTSFPKDTTVAGAEIKLMFTYGGKYEGKGKYIGDIQVRAVKSWSKYFKKLTVIAELPGTSVQNCGTQDEPVACIDLVLTFNVKPLFWANESRTYKYELCGDGTILNPSGVRLPPGATDSIIQKPQ